MKKFLKWTAIITGSLVVLVVVALLLIPRFVDVQHFKPIIERKVAEATGRSFAIGDDLQLSLFPWAGLAFSDLRLGNPAGFDERDFLTIAGFEARLKLFPLLARDIAVKRFVVKDPHLTLIREKDGRTNWALAPTAASAAPAPAPARESQAPGAVQLKSLTVGEFTVTGGAVTWIDRSAGQRHEVTDLRLTLENLALGQSVDLDFAAHLDQKPIALLGRVGPLSMDVDAQPLTFDLTVNALAELVIKLKGQVETPLGDPRFDVQVAMAEVSPRRLLAALGQSLPQPPADDSVLQKLALEVRLQGSPRDIEARDGILRLDDTRMDFTLSARDLAKPAVKLAARGDSLDLDRYLPRRQEPGTPTGGDGAPGGRGDPRKPVDYAPLRRLELDARLDLGHLKVRNAHIQNIQLQVRGRNGVFDLDPLSAELYQGRFQMKGNADLRRQTPQSRFAIGLADIQAGPLVKDVLQKSLIEGRTNADIDLRMAGDDPEAIRRSLNGGGRLTFTDGAIVGIDLAAMVRNVQAAFGQGERVQEKPQTDFTELAIPFTLTNGVFATQEANLKSPLLRTVAAGKADLAQETLDFRVQPTFVNTITGQGDTQARSGIMVPVVVSGTFTQPRFAPDLKALARQQVEEKVLESGELDRVFEKNPELKPLEDTAKGLLKDLFKD
jgi:AsmA protein